MQRQRVQWTHSHNAILLQFDEAIETSNAMLFADALDHAVKYGGEEGDTMRSEALDLAAEDPAFLRAIWEAVAARWDPATRARANLGWWIDQEEYVEIWPQVWDDVSEAAFFNGILHPPMLAPAGAPVF